MPNSFSKHQLPSFVTFPVACQELAARKGFSQVLMKAFKDGQKLQLSEAELQGVPEQLKKRWKGLGAPALCRRWEIGFGHVMP